jgi:serine/threonine protein kinase
MDIHSKTKRKRSNNIVKMKGNGKGDSKRKRSPSRSRSRSRSNSTMNIDVSPQKTGFIQFEESGPVLTRLTNQGSFGQAFHVKTQENTNQLNDNEYFLKIIEINQKNKDTIMDEIEILKKLSHHCEPYIQCYKDVFKNESKIYIITEFLTGYIELFDFVGRINNITNKTYAKIIDKLCRGLMKIHEQKVAHRDIKPENIMIKYIDENDINIKYIDFGFSCDNDGINKIQCTKKMLGTSAYLDPILVNKYFNNTEITFEDLKKSDIWSLGMTIFVMISSIIPIYLYKNISLVPDFERDIYTIIVMNYIHETMNPSVNKTGFHGRYAVVNKLFMDYMNDMNNMKPDTLNLINQKINSVLNRNDEICNIAKEQNYYSLDVRNMLNNSTREIITPKNE